VTSATGRGTTSGRQKTAFAKGNKVRGKESSNENSGLTFGTLSANHEKKSIAAQSSTLEIVV
jgi:hypothetical protein